MITFTKVRLPFGWLSNMSGHSVVYDDKEWRNTEALFQAMRFDDEAIKEAIRAEKSPMTAKMIAKKHKDKMTVEPMSEKDLDNMRICLRLKMKHHPDLKTELMTTGDEQLVEDVTKRGLNNRNGFWGMALKDGQWIGKNMLGNLWAEIRSEIRNEKYQDEQYRDK